MAEKLPNNQGSAEEPKLGKQLEAVVPISLADEPPSKLKANPKSPDKAAVTVSTSSAKQTEGKSPAKSPIRIPVRAAPSGTTQGPATTEAGPVEDLDELHTLQVSCLALYQRKRCACGCCQAPLLHGFCHMGQLCMQTIASTNSNLYCILCWLVTCTVLGVVQCYHSHALAVSAWGCQFLGMCCLPSDAMRADAMPSNPSSRNFFNAYLPPQPTI